MEKAFKTSQKGYSGHAQVYDNALTENTFEETNVQKEENALQGNIFSGMSPLSSGGGDETVKGGPDKVSDYNRKQTSTGNLYYKDVQNRGYYEGMVLQYFTPEYGTDDKLDKLDLKTRSTMFQKIWEFCPKSSDSNPLIIQNTSMQFAVAMTNGETLYFSVEYKSEKSQSDKKYGMSVDYMATTNSKTEIHNQPGVSTDLFSLEKDIIAKDQTASTLVYDNSFPPISPKLDPQPANRQNAFFSQKANADAKSVIFGYANEMNKKFYFINKSIDNNLINIPKKINNPKYADEKNTLERELKELQEYKEKRYLYEFSGIVESGAHKFFVKGAYQRYGNDNLRIGSTYFDIAYLSSSGGINLTNENADPGKSFADAQADVYYKNNPDKKQRPNIIGLNEIASQTERDLVQRYIFDNIYVKGLKDTHFDRILTFGDSGIINRTEKNPNGEFGTENKSEIAYSFTVEKPKPVQSPPGTATSDLEQLNIYVTRLGKISDEEINDPDLLRIKDVYGYSDDTDIVSFVTGRYKAITAGDITGNTREEMIQSVNKIIREKAKTPEWYSLNYGITIINDPSIIRGEAVSLKHYVKGINEDPSIVRARVKSRSSTYEGQEVSSTPVANEKTEDITVIDDELEGVKKWEPEELKYLELSLQKMSPAVLKSLEGVRYFRQPYNMQAGKYNQLGGQRYPNNTIAIYDVTFNSREKIFAGSNDVSPSPVHVITHETAHSIQHSTPELAPNKPQAKENGDLFNAFYTSISASGQTEYARSKPESEFFPEAFALFLHDPDFLHANFPKIYMWILYLQTKGYSPTATESKAFVSRWDAFVKMNSREPDMKEITKIVFNG